MKAARILWVLTFVLVGLFCGTDAWAQGGSGDLTGIVFDPAQAVVAGAKVELSNSATGAVRTEQTTSTGTYRFVALPVVGTYTLKVEATGFKTIIIGHIVITVGTVVTQDVHLELGPVTETVTVEAGVQLVQPTDSTVSELVNRRVWQSYPLENRDTNVFINLMAGAVPDQFAGTTRGASVNGARPGMGNFLVEGYDNNDQGQGGRGATVAGGITAISPEAIQEYRIISHAYTAEYGKGGAFVTDTVLKSGTNAYHGALFEYNRVQALAANSFFPNRQGIQDRLVRNQFGGSFGGPILKGRTFFYASYEAHIRRQSAPLTSVATTQEFLDFVRTGAFQRFQESDPQGFCVQNNGVTCPGGFSNSRTLGPIFSSLLASQPFPLGTPSGACGPTNSDCIGAGLLSSGIVYPVHLFRTITLEDAVPFDQHRGTLKIDHKLSSKDQLNGSLLIENTVATSLTTRERKESRRL